MSTLTAIDSLRSFSLEVDGEFIENQNGGFLTFNNSSGKGIAKAFKIFPGLEVLTFNVTTKRAIEIENLYKVKNCLHFIFCSEGSLTHHFNSHKESQEIRRLQNVIIGSSTKNSSIISIPENTKVKFSLITVVEITNLSKEINEQSQLSLLLTDVMKKIQGKNEYTYFGEISSEALPHVETLIKSNITGLSNRLISEAAVFKILASQYSSHSKDISAVDNKNPLSKNDTIKVIQLSEYISQNLTENLALSTLTKISGLNQKKIQKGFHFFFDETVNKFITNLRILKAKDLLENTDNSISEIVYEIGLNSRSYFSKIFYKKYGLIPKDYRKYHDISNPTFQLSYFSDATPGVGRVALENILKVSREKNAKLNITGCLIYHSKKFFQILEGPKNDILLLVETIKRDKRNKNLQVIFQGVRSGRIFGEWSMGLIQGEFNLSEKESEFDIMPTDFLALTDIQNTVANKYMWEKARNYLIVKQEEVH